MLNQHPSSANHHHLCPCTPVTCTPWLVPQQNSKETAQAAARSIHVTQCCLFKFHPVLGAAMFITHAQQRLFTTPIPCPACLLPLSLISLVQQYTLFLQDIQQQQPPQPPKPPQPPQLPQPLQPLDNPHPLPCLLNITAI